MNIFNAHAYIIKDVPMKFIIEIKKNLTIK